MRAQPRKVTLGSLESSIQKIGSYLNTCGAIVDRTVHVVSMVNSSFAKHDAN